MRKKSILVLLCFVLFISACGKENTPLSGASETESVPSEEGETETVQGDAVLTWAVMGRGIDLSAYESALNQKLNELGAASVRFVDLNIPFEGDYGTYVQSCMDELQKGGYDIVTCPGFLDCYDTYSIMAEAGMLEPVGLDSEQSGLKEAYPDVIWESLRRDGQVYGLLTPHTDLKYYAVFQKEYMDLLGIDPEQVSFSNMEDILKKAEESGLKEENPSFVISRIWPWLLYSEYEDTPCQMVILSEDENGIARAESILENQDVLAQIERMNRWGGEGLVTYDQYWAALGAGSFLVTGVYSSSPENAVLSLRQDYGVSSEAELAAAELPEFDQPFTGRGCTACVLAESSHKKEAMETLALIYSRQELSDALVYGLEGVCHTVENGHIRMTEEYAMDEAVMKMTFGNPFLTTPGVYEASDKCGQLWETVSGARPSQLLGYSFDMEEIGGAVSQLNRLVLEEHGLLLYGGSESWQEELEALRAQAEEAGIEQVIEEMNRQIEEQERS